MQLTLTPNRRIANYLLARHDQQQRVTKGCWPTARILPLNSWLQELWQYFLALNVDSPTIVLSQLQTQTIWQQVIRASPQGGELLKIEHTAKSAMQAWQMLQEWDIEIAKLEPYLHFSVDYEVFYAWSQAYLARLSDLNAIDTGMQTQIIINNLASIEEYIPMEIELYAFAEIPPQTTKLLAALAAINKNIIQQQPQDLSNDIYNFACGNQQDELQQAAGWARNYMQKHSGASIAIVVPDLASTRETVVRCMQIIPADKLNISAPAGLVNYKLIADALHCSRYFQSSFKFNALGPLLRSCYLQHDQQQLQVNALLELELRKSVEAYTSINEILPHIPEESVLYSKLQQLQELQLQAKGKKNCWQWLELWQQWLQVCGWPGGQELQTMESDLLTCWHDLLTSYASLDRILGEHDLATFTQLLYQLAQETPFLPRDSGKVQVQVLGLLEASGLQFDAVWVTGMSQVQWPPEAQHNPFVPLPIQRQFDMPHSSAARELRVARSLTAVLANGGKQQVIFSYPTEVDESITNVSKLVASYSELNTNFVSVPAIESKLSLEKITDHAAPEFHGQDIGGSQVLQLQANCPFRAYGEIRLKAKPMLEPDFMLTMAERGELIHQVLADFWRKNRSLINLQKYSPIAIREQLDRIIIRVLRQWQRRKPRTFTPEYLELETQRLLQLSISWLEYEKQRADFNVWQVETKCKINLAGYNYNLRVDRVDRLADGGLVLIDYKTGRPNVSSWFKENILEPQLPLYSLEYFNEVTGIVFAQVRSEMQRFTGVCLDGEEIPDATEFNKLKHDNKQETWQQQLMYWREILSKYTLDFVQGVAVVQPVEPNSCTTCNLQSLCRINELST